MDSNFLICSMFAILCLLCRFIQAAVLFEGATVISWNDTTSSLEIVRDASLLIEQDIVTSLSASAISSYPLNTTFINATGMIISPGFIDTHHHLWQTAFKTIGSNTSLSDYFQRYSEFSPARDYFTPSDLYVGQLAGALELLYEGTTAVLDHAHASWSDETVDACVNATFDSGIRSFYAHALHVLPTNYTWDAQVAKLQSLSEDARFEQQDATSIVSLGLAWDDFFTGEMANITELWQITKSRNLSVVTTHFIGGPFGYVNSPTVLDAYGWLNDTVPVVFGHSSFMEWGDAQILRDTNQYISTTPESELHFGHNHPYAHLIQDQASIGVDCHFTYSSSMVQQARLWLQTLRWPNYLETLENFQVPRNNPMSVDQAFHLITRAGALALRRPDLGVIKIGAKADLNVFKTDSPNMIGWSDPVAAIILHSDIGDLVHVLVDGQFVKRDGKLVYGDYESVQRDLTASARRIQQIWANTDWAYLSGSLNAQSAPYGDAEVIDTQRGDGTGY